MEASYREILQELSEIEGVADDAFWDLGEDMEADMAEICRMDAEELPKLLPDMERDEALELQTIFLGYQGSKRESQDAQPNAEQVEGKKRKVMQAIHGGNKGKLAVRKGELKKAAAASRAATAAKEKAAIRQQLAKEPPANDDQHKS